MRAKDEGLLLFLACAAIASFVFVFTPAGGVLLDILEKLYDALVRFLQQLFR